MSDPKPLSEIVHSSWVEALSPVEQTIHEIGARLRQEVSAGHGYLPAGTDVLRAFTYPMQEVKVLVVGQDPYPTPGHPMGLSFSVQPGVKPPRSLENIFTEMVSDLGVDRPTSGDLTPWSRQGVMLLNRVLTVRPGAPASHRGWGWETVTQRAIEALVQRPEPLVAILWGRPAQSLTPMLGQTPIIASPHPSPLSASRGFFGSRPFSRANEELTRLGTQPVDWRLP